MRSSEELLACPACGGELRGLRCVSCEARYAAPQGIPALRVGDDARTEQVRAFYAAAPFPGYPRNESLSSLRARAGRSAFARQLDAAIPGDAVVLEMGCGTGQLSLFLASGGRTVVGADLGRPSLELARAAADRYRLEDVLFVETDLRSPGLQRDAFDVVICSGVLHHTRDPRASFASVARLVRPGGVLVVGVYHAVARLPLRMRRTVARITGFRWVPFDPVLRSRKTDAERREAWLRDQYLHPEEHVHTRAEVRRWFEENGFRLLRTFPSSELGHEQEDLFASQDDDWAPEAVLIQLSWPFRLGGEGGLFVCVGGRA